MSLTEIDFQILKKQLLEFEKRLDEVETEIKILSAYVDTSLKEADTDVSSAYALSSVSLVDAGSNQQWQHKHKGGDNV